MKGWLEEDCNRLVAGDNVLWRDKAKDITVVRAFLKDTEEKNREEDRKLKNKEGVKDLRGKAEQGR